MKCPTSSNRALWFKSIVPKHLKNALSRITYHNTLILLGFAELSPTYESAHCFSTLIVDETL